MLAKQIKPGDRLAIDYLGIRTVENVNYLSPHVDDNGDVVEVKFVGGLTQYYGATEEIEDIYVQD